MDTIVIVAIILAGLAIIFIAYMLTRKPKHIPEEKLFQQRRLKEEEGLTGMLASEPLSKTQDAPSWAIPGLQKSAETGLIPGHYYDTEQRSEYKPYKPKIPGHYYEPNPLLEDGLRPYSNIEGKKIVYGELGYGVLKPSEELKGQKFMAGFE